MTAEEDSDFHIAIHPDYSDNIEDTLITINRKENSSFGCISESSKQNNLKQYDWLNYVFWNYIYLPWIAPMYI